MFYLDLVVDDLLGSTASGTTGNFDIVPGVWGIVCVLVHICVIGWRPQLVIVLGNRVRETHQNGRRDGNDGNSNGERGSHGFVFLCWGRTASIFLEGKGIRTFLLGHGKR